MRADLDTGAASNAFLWEELDFRLDAGSFRVMAPETAQVAAFQKHCGTNPRPIVDRKPLYVKNVSAFR
jgi:hypothetical protein